MTILLSLCVICALLAVACNKTENANTTNTNTPVASASPKTAAPSPATAAEEKIGVPECDDFLAAYENCVSGKVPEAARAQYKTAIDQWRSSWRKLAANPATKGTLAAACKQSAESARASMKSYGCTF
jgi:hypothetical protein